ncbi:MAG: pyruvate kinase [Parachlamydia sp.]|nr:pyruvate kinase [Parachlamydia sp.]
MELPNRTKIICTIGPAVSSLDKMIELIRSGMNVARLNFSHGTHEEHLNRIESLKEARKQLQVPLAIMLDTKGPEIRLGKIKQGSVELKAGQKWLLVKEKIEGDAERVTVLPESIYNQIQTGMCVLFDDGYISSYVIERTAEGIVVKIENGGVIRSGKGVNIPNVSLELPDITPEDEADIRFGCRQDIDLIAASFVRSPEQILAIKKLLAEEKKSDILIIAKIENSEGVNNFDSIIQVADGIMIARGDLGVEVPLSQVPKLQKMMIRKCYLAGKPSVTATQMLESMINNPRPTRAEASDVANAIYDGTSAVMLSGETAIGKYPIAAVNIMKEIIKEAEGDVDYRAFFNLYGNIFFRDVPSAVSLACVKTAYSTNAKAIFACTSSGSSARLVSRLRPPMLIVAMTPNQKCYHQLASNWGITPVYNTESTTITEAFAILSAYALERKLVSYGDLVIISAGTPFGVSGTTNMMLVESIGDVLVRAKSGAGARVYGNVAFVLSPEGVKPYAVRGQLLVIAKCDERYQPLIQQASGVILQNHIDDAQSENHLIELAQIFHKPYVVRADAATQVLKEGQLVTLDPEKALVYKGVVL